MVDQLTFAGFLTLGLMVGFGHCVGMCAPFVLFINRRFSDPEAAGRSVLIAQLWYTAGRITTYTAMGVAAGAVGSAMELAGDLVGVQRAAAVIAGGLLMVYGAVSLLDLAPRLFHGGGPFFQRVAGLLKKRTPNHPYLMGLLLGFLPCPPVYSAVLASAAMGGPVGGGEAVLLFGLGTVPAMLGISIVDELLARHRAVINRLSQVFLLVMGAWFVYQGLSHLL